MLDLFTYFFVLLVVLFRISQERGTDVNVGWNDGPEFDQGYDSDGENRRERNDFNIEKGLASHFDILATTISPHKHLFGTPTTRPLRRTSDLSVEAPLALLIFDFHRLKSFWVRFF
ncbi:hypothetical protein F2Q68_00014401 [Brassica cretica]|uniref:Secreted protein n=2 Tax=Brassica cretica TaxID=69181 RepID=A0ABQ7F0A0_BRACR|nr:hypothetical protein F2Q68_00014401 [Brassica cretica]KAF3608479.1 hypothetical protein DY000_02046890 [Brassica cretica]